MSWNLRDHRHGRTDASGEAPLSAPTFHDDEPLPTYAVGLEEYETDTPPLPRYVFRQQGYLSAQELDRFAQLVTRGIAAL